VSDKKIPKPEKKKRNTPRLTPEEKRTRERKRNPQKREQTPNTRIHLSRGGGPDSGTMSGCYKEGLEMKKTKRGLTLWLQARQQQQREREATSGEGGTRGGLISAGRRKKSKER